MGKTVTKSASEISKEVLSKDGDKCFRPLIVCLLVLQVCAFGEVPPTQRDKSSDKGKITVQAKLSHDRIKPGSVCFALLVVTVQEGWHINSATPSDDNLVATSAEVQRTKVIDSVSIQYPPAVEREFDFTDGVLEVYEGMIKILVRLGIRKSAKLGAYLIPATIVYQACSNSVCLAPSAVQVNIPVRVTSDGRTIHEINKELFEPYTSK